MRFRACFACMLLACCIAHIAMASQGTQVPAQINQLLEEAEQELHQTVWKSLGPATRALELAEKSRDISSAARAHLLLGKIYLDLQDTEQAMSHLMPALSTFMDMGDKRNEAVTRNRLGRLYRELNDLEQAHEQLERSLGLYREVEDEKGISRVLNSLGAYYYAQEDFGNALKYFNESLEHLSTMNDPVGLSAAHNNIALVHQKMGEFETALLHYAKALEIGTQASYKAVITSALINRATLYFQIGKLNAAFEGAGKAEPIAAAIGDLDSSLEAMVLMANVRRQQGRFQEALEFREKADALRDTLAEKRLADQVAQIRGQQELLEKERTIQLLEKENRIQELTIHKQRTNRNLMILGLALLASFTIGFLALFMVRARKNQIIQAQLDDLSEAMERISVLKGLLPICSSCRKVRDDKGYWVQVEKFISEHSDTTFDQGICPACAGNQKDGPDRPEG